MNFVHAQLITTAIGLLVLPAFAQESGKVAPAPSAPASVPATTAASAAARSFGYYSYGGRIYRIENGRAVPVMNEQTIRVGPNGIVGFDGRPLNIPEGQMMGADGRLAPLPRNISGLPTPGAVTTTKPGVANPTTGGVNTVPATEGDTTIATGTVAPGTTTTKTGIAIPTVPPPPLPSGGATGNATGPAADPSGTATSDAATGNPTETTGAKAPSTPSGGRR